MGKVDAERAAIEAAIKRLLAGTPQQSTGALTIVQLALEAGVKRWVLTHKHTDLAAEFRARRTGTTAVVNRAVELRARDAEESNSRLRSENTALRGQLDAYAQLIHELATELSLTRIPPAVLSTADRRRH